MGDSGENKMALWSQVPHFDYMDIHPHFWREWHTQHPEGCKNSSLMIVQSLSKYQPFIFLKFYHNIKPFSFAFKNSFPNGSSCKCLLDHNDVCQ